MKIKTTLGEILEKCYNWSDFCIDKGYSLWCVNEGGGDVEIDLTEEEAIKYGVIK